jgi:hypothetical protein
MPLEIVQTGLNIVGSVGTTVISVNGVDVVGTSADCREYFGCSMNY